MHALSEISIFWNETQRRKRNSRTKAQWLRFSSFAICVIIRAGKMEYLGDPIPSRVMSVESARVFECHLLGLHNIIKIQKVQTDLFLCSRKENDVS